MDRDKWELYVIVLGLRQLPPAIAVALVFVHRVAEELSPSSDELVEEHDDRISPSPHGWSRIAGKVLPSMCVGNPP